MQRSEVRERRLSVVGCPLSVIGRLRRRAWCLVLCAWCFLWRLRRRASRLVSCFVGRLQMAHRQDAGGTLALRAVHGKASGMDRAAGAAAPPVLEAAMPPVPSAWCLVVPGWSARGAAPLQKARREALY